MKNFLTRLDSLKEWQQTVKHMRGMHDQRKHNRYPPGYIAQEYVPHPKKSRFVSGSVLSKNDQAMWKRDFGAVESFDDRPFTIMSGVMMNRATNLDTQGTGMSLPTGQELADRMDDSNPTRPMDVVLAKYLMERGYQVTNKLSRNSKTRYWGTGKGYFDGFRSLSPQRKLTYAELQTKSVFWQRAYIAAVQRYTLDSAGKPIPNANIAEAYKKAVQYADHVEHITKRNSPYDLARQMTAIGLLREQIGLTGISGASGDIGAQEFILRKLLAVPEKLWMKYKPGTPITDIPFIDSMFTQTEFGSQNDIRKNGLNIIDTMTRGKNSIFSYVQELFPEMTAHLDDVLTQAKLGFENTAVPPVLLQSVANGDANTPPAFAPRSMYEFDTKPRQEPGRMPGQVNETDFVYDETTRLLIPKSSAELANAVDPGGVITATIRSSSRGEVNSANIENLMATARGIAQSTGLPLELVTSVISYWQHGSQTAGTYPIPMLVRLQQAAAELFGLKLGENGEQLSAYQKSLFEEAVRIANGGRQFNSASPDSLQRTMFENAHLFKDFFEKNYSTFTDLQEMNPINASEKVPPELKKYIHRRIDEWDSIKGEPPLTPERKMEIMQQIDAYYKRNPYIPSGSQYIPGTPYATAQDARKAFLKSIYDRTQQLLANAGIKRATLYRSVSLTKPQLDAIEREIRQRTGNKSFTVYNPDGTFNPSSLADVDIKLPRNALESWTHDVHTASLMGMNIDNGPIVIDRRTDRFGKEPKGRSIVAEITIATDVDASRIVSTPATGFGQYSEGEIVITGNNDDSVRMVASVARSNKDQEMPYNTWKGKSYDQILSQLRERMKMSSVYYWYTDYQRMRMKYVQLRESLLRRRAQLIKEADDMGVQR